MMFGVGLFVSLSVGVGLALGGLAMLVFPPKRVNPFYGYRTGVRARIGVIGILPSGIAHE